MNLDESLDKDSYFVAGSFYRLHKDVQGSWKDVDSIKGHFNKATDLVLSKGFVLTSSLNEL